ncbi:glycine--tRNA ligase [Candidatus Uhrbacteria bacterium]|nr:glycine--tRNA ligase [Candidatus Uhrbacteria bacterium]
MTTMDKLVSLCKRRGFLFPSSEIYGGLGAVYDYGPLGVELKNNIKKLWWKTFVQERDDMVGIDSSILMHPNVWEASGHLKSFSDPLIDCKKCHKRFRADHLVPAEPLVPHVFKEKHVDHRPNACPECGGELTVARPFNLMFKTFLGPVEDATSVAYLRPETAAGMFVNFKQVLDSMHCRLPFGIAQIGKAFRNEITTENFIFRTREFEIMEFEYFCAPDDAPKKFDELLIAMKNFATVLGLHKEKFQDNDKKGKDLAHYSSRTIDLEYAFPFGVKELWGIANRTDYDLTQHEKASGQKLQYRDPVSGKEFTPHVVEPTFGLDRTMLAVLAEAYEEVPVRSGSEETKKKHDAEVVLHLPVALSPIKVAVLPLSKKETLQSEAQAIATTLRKQWMVQYDETGAIGKRYRRQDEIGTPFCVTVDFETATDKKVTVRDRDTMAQERVAIAELVFYLKEKF